MKRFLCAVLLMSAWGGVFAQTHVELILDASGSMWNKLESGEYRIEAAKQVLSDFIRDLPPTGVNVGLRVYGSRVAAIDEGACEDSELFVAMTGVEKAALQDTVDTVTATGATPIALSLERAAQDFPAEASERVIILVTDGEESCGGDLQAVAAQLRDQGFDIDIKIIGFALDDAAQQSFEGVGEFVSADSASELAGALAGAVADVIVEDIEAPSERTEVTLTAPETTSAGKTFEVSYEGDIQENDYLSIVTPDTPDGEYAGYKYVDFGTFDPAKLTAPFDEGSYEIRYMSAREDEVLARLALSVEESDITFSYSEEVLLGSEFEVTWTGPDGERDYITIVPLGAPEGEYSSYAYTQQGSPVQLTAPSVPGRYEIRYSTDRSAELGQNFYSQPITVLPATYSLSAPEEVLVDSEFEVTWTGPDGASDYITIVPANAPEGEYLSYVYTREGSPVQLTAPSEPGDYEIRYSTDRSDAKGTSFYSVPITVK